METIRVLESETSPAKHDAMAARVVMLKKTKPIWKDQPFSTHLEVIPGDRPAYMVSGHYDMTLAEAMTDFQKRCGNEGINPGKALGNITEACKVSRKR